MFVLLFPIAATKLLLFKNEVESLNHYKAITNILGSIDKRIAKSQELVYKYIQILDYVYDYYFGKKHNIPNAKVIDVIKIISGYPFDSATYSSGIYKKQRR